MGMIYTYNELQKKLGYYQLFKEAIDNGKYFKVGRGIYSDQDTKLNELEAIFAIYPNAVLTLESAFSFYDLSDYVPAKYTIATSQKAHKIINNKIQQLYYSDGLLDIGKTKIKTQFGYINVYDKERMLIELFRLKHKLPFTYYKEVVNSYRELVKDNGLNINKLVKYCHMFRSGQSILSRIQEVVF